MKQYLTVQIPSFLITPEIIDPETVITIMSWSRSEQESHEPLTPTLVLEALQGTLKGRGASHLSRKERPKGQSGNQHLQHVPVLHAVKQHPDYNFLTNFIKHILLGLLWFLLKQLHKIFFFLWSGCSCTFTHLEDGSSIAKDYLIRHEHRKIIFLKD